MCVSLEALLSQRTVLVQTPYTSVILLYVLSKQAIAAPSGLVSLDET